MNSLRGTELGKSPPRHLSRHHKKKEVIITMPLQPNIEGIKERLLVYGLAGSGKTRGYLSILKLAAMTGSDAKGYVIDSDGGSVAHMLGASDTFAKIRDRVEIHEVYEWPDWVEAANRIQKAAKPGDWVLIDMISDAWDAVQNYVTEQVYECDRGDFMLGYRLKIQKQRKNKGNNKGEAPANDQVDWQAIKALYKQFMAMIYLRTKANVYATASQRDLRTDYMADSKDLRRMFGEVGVLPQGEKNLAHRFHTVLLCTGSQSKGEWALTTIKDREREAMEDHQVKDFARDYLIKIAGWGIRK